MAENKTGCVSLALCSFTQWIYFSSPFCLPRLLEFVDHPFKVHESNISPCLRSQREAGLTVLSGLMNHGSMEHKGSLDH